MYTKSTKFFYACLSIILGAILVEFFTVKLVFGVVIFTLLIFLIRVIPRCRFHFILFLIFIAANIWAGMFNPQINKQHISYYNEQNFTFTAKVSSEPDVRLDHQKITLQPLKYKGQVLVKSNLYPEYYYGDILIVNCKLQTPEPIEDFRYDKYLAKQSVYSVCYQPQITVSKHDPGFNFIGSMLKVKSAMQSKINRTLGEPQAALLSGILIGARQGLPSELLENFNKTGITHIIAISGFNITIIVVILLNLSKHVYLNRKKAFWLIFVFLLFFVVITGLSPSVIRAAIMGLMVLIAKNFGRAAQPRNLLMASATVMVIFNPRILVWDAGFQLSFLSTIGLIYLSPILLKYFQKIPQSFSLRENLVSTFSAILMTLPLILFQFGRLSVVSPVVNLLVLPIIPIAMLVGFIQFILSSFSLLLGQIIGWFSWLLLAYVIKIVDIFSSLSWVAIDIHISWWLMLLFYLILFKIIKSRNLAKLR
jgi:competence protein ComEC